MCTVSIFYDAKKENDFILTSNRDEAVGRKTIPPDFYDEAGVRMLYPRDMESAGSWIGISDHNRLACLLNGAFTPHKRKLPYRMSRGVVLKQLLAATSIETAVPLFRFEGIEPFTVIIVEWEPHLRFLELVWDGKQRHFGILGLKDHLWFSSPLYDPVMKNERRSWFQKFRKDKEPSPEGIWDFHHQGGVGNKDIDLVMDRGFVKTQSITQVVKSKHKITMSYEDLTDNSGPARSRVKKIEF